MENDAKKFTRWLKEAGMLSTWLNSYLNYKSPYDYKKKSIIEFFNTTDPLNYIESAFVWEPGNIRMWSELNRLWYNYCT